MLKDTLVQLMEDVRNNCLVYIAQWKSVPKWAINSACNIMRHTFPVELMLFVTGVLSYASECCLALLMTDVVHDAVCASAG
jgi:hypothetical protein